MPPPSNSPVYILLVEDSADDADLMTEALREGRLDVRIRLAEDGEQALALLRDGSPPPDLILLDLHLPRKNGFEVLKELKEDPELRRIPVVILASLEGEQAVIDSCSPSTEVEQAFIDAYNLHANCCVSKPVDQDEYALVVRKIEHFWLSVAKRVWRP
jgi:CheY-like chemotaxis protein